MCQLWKVEVKQEPFPGCIQAPWWHSHVAAELLARPVGGTGLIRTSAPLDPPVTLSSPGLSVCSYVQRPQLLQ